MGRVISHLRRQGHPGLAWGAMLCVALFLGGCVPTTPPIGVFLVSGGGQPHQAIDVLFLPDDDYGDMTDATDRQAFLDDVNELIDQGFAKNNAINANLSLFNFWFSTFPGDVQPGADICPSVTWPKISGAEFAEVIVLVHTNSLRDCAWGRKVTSEPDMYGTVVHEASHAAFGLPDEYCCDGGYWNIAPVMYASGTACTSDPLNASWRSCHSFTSSRGTIWWRSEDNDCDVMACYGGVLVREYGPADWQIVEGVLSNLPGSGVTTPSVFAPGEWP